MFGMSSKEFWEDDPQLYWSYRSFYLKKMEEENKQQYEIIKYKSWLQGNMNCIATSVSLTNSFSKQKAEYPTYDEIFGKEHKDKKISENDINLKVQEDFNAWARL